MTMDKSLVRKTATLYGAGWLLVNGFLASLWWPLALLGCAVCAWSIIGWGPLRILLRDGALAPEPEKPRA